jgi:Tol biopolymer transport system component
MVTKHFFQLWMILLFTVGLSACSTLEVRVETAVPPAPTPTGSTATQAPVATQPGSGVQPASTSVPANTSTPENTPTPESTVTATAIAPLPPTPSSPYTGLTYRLGDQLYRIDTSGQQVHLAPGLDPQYLPAQYSPRAAFSSDGRYMVSWWDFSDLWLVDLTTGQAKNLTQTPDRVEYSAQFWLARPDTIIFMSQPVDNQGPSAGYLSAIQLDGSGYRVLDDVSSSIGFPALSPDGKTIAYDRGGEAWLYIWDNGPEVINLADYNVTEFLKIANPAWSPTGKYLAWMANTDPASPDFHAGVALFNMESKSYRMLHTFQSLGHGGWYLTPIWSPDGTWLVIFDESQNQPGLWVNHPDGSGESLVFAASSVRSVGGLAAWWSADSQQLLVMDPNAEGGIRTDLIGVFTGKKLTLPLPEGALPVAWVF